MCGYFRIIIKHTLLLELWLFQMGLGNLYAGSWGLNIRAPHKRLVGRCPPNVKLGIYGYAGLHRDKLEVTITFCGDRFDLLNFGMENNTIWPCYEKFCVYICVRTMYAECRLLKTGRFESIWWRPVFNPDIRTFPNCSFKKVKKVCSEISHIL